MLFILGKVKYSKKDQFYIRICNPAKTCVYLHNSRFTGIQNPNHIRKRREHPRFIALPSHRVLRAVHPNIAILWCRQCDVANGSTYAYLIGLRASREAPILRGFGRRARISDMAQLYVDLISQPSRACALLCRCDPLARLPPTPGRHACPISAISACVVELQGRGAAGDGTTDTDRQRAAEVARVRGGQSLREGAVPARGGNLHPRVRSHPTIPLHTI